MKKSHIIPLFTVFILALVVFVHISAGGDIKKSNPTPKPTPKPAQTVIQSIDASSITVKEPHSSAAYKITQFTEIKFKGQPAKVTDLKAGMRVSVTAGGDPTVADLISADDPPKK